jgi:hypothetical protein
VRRIEVHLAGTTAMLSRRDYRLLLAVARAAEKWRDKQRSFVLSDGSAQLFDAFNRLNARPSGKGKDDE